VTRIVEACSEKLAGSASSCVGRPAGKKKGKIKIEEKSVELKNSGPSPG
jgi:hypothetical protein